MAQSLLILTNTPALGLALRHSARHALGDDISLASMTYQESIALLTPRRIQETDMFILDLFRDYPGGLRAEGVVLAQRWLPRTPCLIVSPLYLAHELQCPAYWDVAAEDSLIARIRQIRDAPFLCRRNFERLTQRFERYLALPPQH
jgi:hypothetical protein